MSRTSVWVVTSGIYSDYQIERIFSNEKACADFCASLSRYYRSDCRYSEWEVDAEFDPSRVYWKVGIRASDGHTTHMVRFDELPAGVTLNWFERYRHELFKHDPPWIGYVQAPTEEAALKIAQEQLAMALAQEAGIG